MQTSFTEPPNTLYLENSWPDVKIQSNFCLRRAIDIGYYNNIYLCNQLLYSDYRYEFWLHVCCPVPYNFDAKW